MNGLAGPDEVRQQVRSLSRQGLATVAAAAVVVGYVAAWLVADYVGRWAGVVVFALLAGYLLVQQPTPRAIASRGLYLLAGLVLVAPVFLNLPLVTSPYPGLAPAARSVLHPGVYAFALVFVVLAAGLAGAGYWLDDR